MQLVSFFFFLIFLLWKKNHRISNLFNHFSGPQVFQETDAPRYFKGFAVHIACYACIFIILIFLRIWFVLQNKKKERILKEEMSVKNPEQDLSHSFDDLTDRQNLYFQYVY
jgi:hypothetical protein